MTIIYGVSPVLPLKVADGASFWDCPPGPGAALGRFVRQSGNIDEIAGDGTIKSCAYSVGTAPGPTKLPPVAVRPILPPLPEPTPVPVVPLLLLLAPAGPPAIEDIVPEGVVVPAALAFATIAGLHLPGCPLVVPPKAPLKFPLGAPCRGVARYGAKDGDPVKTGGNS